MTDITPRYFLSLTLFMTTLSFVVVLFHRKVHKHVDLLFWTFIVMFMGLYFAHVSPKYFVLRSIDNVQDNIILRDPIYIITSDILHIVPFFVIYMLYGRYYTKRINFILLTRTICILLFYYTFISPSKIYNVSDAELFSLFFVAVAIYVLFLFTCFHVL